MSDDVRPGVAVLSKLGRLGLDAINGYRAMFDLVPPDGSSEQITLRLYLRSGDRALTETWLYQLQPPPAAERAVG